MLSKAVHMGMRVRVRDGAQSGPGIVGTVTQVYGDPSFRAAEVTFEDGRTILYWHFQIDPVER